MQPNISVSAVLNRGRNTAVQSPPLPDPNKHAVSSHSGPVSILPIFVDLLDFLTVTAIAAAIFIVVLRIAEMLP